MNNRESGIDMSDIHPMIWEVFQDEKLLNSIPAEIRDNPQIMNAIIRNCNDFKKLKRSGDIFGPDVSVPETKHADGRTRPEEIGSEILMDKVTELGINPKCVLYFRRTQPTDTNVNPEHYWTSDYFETLSGLQQEIPSEKREKTIILCTTLDDLASDSKLILDQNDDDGIPVRRVNQSAYDQKRTLFQIRP